MTQIQLSHRARGLLRADKERNVMSGIAPRSAAVSSPKRHSGTDLVFPSSDREGRTAPVNTQWPLQSHLELGAYDTAVPCARLHTRQVLWE
jgi:hypothetical protein